MHPGAELRLLKPLSVIQLHRGIACMKVQGKHRVLRGARHVFEDFSVSQKDNIKCDRTKDL